MALSGYGSTWFGRRPGSAAMRRSCPRRRSLRRLARLATRPISGRRSRSPTSIVPASQRGSWPASGHERRDAGRRPARGRPFARTIDGPAACCSPARLVPSTSYGGSPSPTRSRERHQSGCPSMARRAAPVVSSGATSRAGDAMPRRSRHLACTHLANRDSRGRATPPSQSRPARRGCHRAGFRPAMRSCPGACESDRSG